MLRAVLITVLGLSVGAFDPIRVVSASKPIESPLAESCVVAALRSADTVRKAGVSDAGSIYAELIVPEHLDSPEARPEVGVEEQRNEGGELEITFSMLWVGGKGSREYRDYVETVVEDLRDRTIERCASQ